MYEQKEFLIKSPDEYSEFGKSLNKYQKDMDLSNSCLEGNFFNPDKTADLGMCENYMSQRCSVKWDDNCVKYVNSLNDLMKEKKFIRDTANKKFCQLSSDSNCTVMCQPFNPISQESPSVCNYVGNEVYKDSSQTTDVGWYFPVIVSPTYMGSCKQTCNLKEPSEINDNDPIINSCLKYGYCNDILTNICQISKDNNKEIKNNSLKIYCENLDFKIPKEQFKSSKSNEKFKNKNNVYKQDDKTEEYYYKIVFVMFILYLSYVLYNYIKRKRS